MSIPRPIEGRLSNGDRHLWEIREAREAASQESVELSWRADNVGEVCRQALMDEAPRERELNFDEPLRPPEDLLDALDDLRYTWDRINQPNKKSVVFFNSDEHQAEFHNERARRRNAAGTLTGSEWRSLRAAFGGKCAYCGVGYRMVLEHVRPIACGGTTSVDNCVPACWYCNKAKGLKSPEEWLGKERADAFRLRWAGAILEVMGKRKAR